MLIQEEPLWSILSTSPRRVVSLVPSLTDTMLGFGFEPSLVGITDFCPWKEGTEEPARVGGVKDPDLDKVLSLEPDLVLADREENDRLVMKELDRAGLLIWLTYAPTVRSVLDLLSDLVRVFQGGEEAIAQLRLLESSVNWVRLSHETSRSIRYFCPIWMGEHEQAGVWWMTFNGETYCSDLLAHFGGENCFGDRIRRYPLLADLGIAPAEPTGERDQRYPRVTVREVVQSSPDMMLIPDEPYAFNESALEELTKLLEGTPAVRNGHIHRIDGRDLTWNGSRIGHALKNFPELFDGS